ncbi:hypothetical protein F511_16498 [Dorcoceras hygrometricum]|uniref:Uncharacterized protein n=1 Tax=Dorcoceras hygrometricum TaxID=472368 RepID=A0A2Z7C9P6_9LAMI|nr:hypothetical protein F511_16498 [Dorcoceras hygrometricum]
MRIRPPELETSICDVKYHVSLVGNIDVLSMQMDSDLVIYQTTLVRTFQVVTICRVDKSEVLVVLIIPHYSKRKWVYLVTLAMSLFNLQDVCIVIGSLATLDLPMIVDLIVIYVFKGPYCSLTMTDWFLQVLSVIPSHAAVGHLERRHQPPPSAASCCDWTCSDQLFEEFSRCRAWHGGMRPCVARYVGGGRRRATAVRRISGSDATAIFLLCFVRACPGQPMKFSGQYSILGRFWSDQN